jgi:hypothetical protein
VDWIRLEGFYERVKNEMENNGNRFSFLGLVLNYELADRTKYLLNS